MLTSSDFVVSTSDESCLSVCVRFLLASARARVSSLGLYVPLVLPLKPPWVGHGDINGLPAAVLFVDVAAGLLP